MVLFVSKKDHKLITFLDEKLRIEEEKDYLKRIETHPETHSKAGFDEKLNCFGTLTVVHKIDVQSINTPDTNKRGKKEHAEKIAVEQTVYQAYK